MSFRVVELGPMKVASYRYVGESPEDGAYEGLISWIASRNVLAKGDRPRFFGFNNPNPTEGDPVYGSEVWMALHTEVKGDDAITIKDVSGGCYAMVRAERIEEGWERVHKEFGSSAEENGCEYNGERQWLEEHFPDPEDLDACARSGREPKWIAFARFSPIKAKR